MTDLEEGTARAAWPLALVAAVAMTAAIVLSQDAAPAAAPPAPGADDAPARSDGVVRLEGTIATEPRTEEDGADELAHLARHDHGWRFMLDVDAAADGRGVPVDADASVLVRVDEDGTRPHRGERVTVTGRWRAPRAPPDPGAPASTGDGTVDVPRASLVAIDPASRAGAWAWLRRMRAAANDALRQAIPGWCGASARALVLAMTTGVRDPGLTVTAADFRAAGMSHVLAISGFNVAVLVAAAVLCAGACGARAWHRAVVAVAVAGVFLAFTEPEVSVLRAGLGAGLAAVVGLRGGRARGLGTMGAVACVTLLVDPAAATKPGFQLSFGVVAALLVLAGPAAARWDARLDAAWRRRHGRPMDERLAIARGALVEALVSSLVAWTVSTPIALWHGASVALFAAPLSVFTMPLAAIVTVAGAVAMMLGAVPLAGAVVASGPGAIAGAAAGALERIASTATTLPGATWWVGRQPGWVVLVGAACAWFAWGAVGRRTRLACWTALACVGAVAWSGAALPAGDAVQPGELRVEAIDVGNGRCLLARTCDAAVLYDAGTNATDSVGSMRIVPALAARGVRRLDALFLCRPRLGNVSGVPEVLDALPVGVVMVDATTARQLRIAREGTAAAMRAAFDRHRVSVQAIDAAAEFAFGRLCATVQPMRPPGDGGRTPTGLCVRLRDRDAFAMRAAAVIVGDVDLDALDPSGPVIAPAAAMELPCHGAWRTDLVDAVRTVRPEAILQPADRSRLEHDRWGAVLAGAHRGITARDGSIRVDVQPDGHPRCARWVVDRWVRF